MPMHSESASLPLPLVMEPMSSSTTTNSGTASTPTATNGTKPAVPQQQQHGNTLPSSSLMRGLSTSSSSSTIPSSSNIKSRKFYGRDCEKDSILQAYRRVQAGANRMGEEVPPQNHQYLHYHSLEVADASSSLFSSFANDDSTAATGIDGTASSITVDSRRNQNSCTGCSSGTEWVLIQGAAGVGKTAMAHFPRTIPKRSNANGSIFNSDTDESSNTPATTTTTTATVDSGATTEADCGFVTAKFHPLQRADPQTAFVEAIADWVHRQLAATSNNKNSNEDWREVFLVPQKQNGSTSNIGQENDNNIGLQSLLDMVPALKNVLLLEAKRDPDSNTSTKDSETTSLAQDSTSEDESTSDATEKRLRQLTKSYQSERLRWPTAQVNGGGGGGGSTSSGGLVCRWKEAVVWFVQSLASWNHRRHQAPLVFLFDDLHCADECSIGIVLALTESKAISNVLFMGTAQANDLGQTPEHLTRLFKSFRESNVQFTRLSLSCLQESDVDCLLADLVHVDSERTMDFVSFVASQTRGNVCDIWWYLDMLQSKQLLRLDDTGKIIAWDMDDIRLEALNLDEHFKSMITKLSTFDLELLTIASFLGPTLDERIVMSLVECDVDTFALFTQNVSSLGLLSYDSSRESWFFTQSIIQEKTCQLIPESEREYYHYRIGRKLWRRFDLNELDHYIFLVVDQLSYSFNCITNPKESLAIAKLCLCAGVRAVHLSSFQASIGYLENGIALLSPNGFELAYETWLDLHNAAAEVANSLGNYKRVHELVDEVLLHAQTNGDKLRAQAVMIHAFGSDGRFSDALTLALGVLKTLGESIPMKPSKPMILLEFLVLRRRLSRMTNAAILRLPTMVDIHKLAAMQMMNLLFFSALMKKNEIVPYIGFRMVRLTLDYGLSAVSCIGFILFASTLSGVGNDIKEGCRISQLSFSLFDKFDSKAWLARLSALYYDFLHGWTNPVGDPRETIALASASQAGIESGDVEFAMACDLVHFFNAYETASLSQQCNEWGKMAERMKFYGKSSGMSLTLAKRQMMQNLMENRNEDPCVLEGDFLLPSDIASIRTMPLIESWSQMLNGLLCFLFGRYRDAAAYACKGRLMATNSFGPHGGGLAVFLCGLMDVVNAQQENKKLCVRNSFAKRCSKKLCRSAANGEPLNFIGKHYLLEAELAVLHGNVTDAHRLYVAAISTSQKAKLIMQTAIANERAARFLWGLGDHSRAAELFREAIVWYKKWGAVLKVSHLESEVREMGVCLT